MVGMLRGEELNPNMQAAEYLQAMRIRQTAEIETTFLKSTNDCPRFHGRLYASSTQPSERQFASLL
jgi:hypothetical protein